MQQFSEELPVIWNGPSAWMYARGSLRRAVRGEQEWEHLKTKQLRQEWSRLGRNVIAAIKLHFELLLALMISFFLSKVFHSFPDLNSTS